MGEEGREGEGKGREGRERKERRTGQKDTDADLKELLIA